MASGWGGKGTTRQPHPTLISTLCHCRAVDGSCIDGRPSTLAHTSQLGSNRSDMVFAGPLVNHPNADPTSDLDPPSDLDLNPPVRPPSGLAAGCPPMPPLSRRPPGGGTFPNVTFYHTVLDVPHDVRLEMQRRLPAVESEEERPIRIFPPRAKFTHVPSRDEPPLGDASAASSSDLDLDPPSDLDPCRDEPPLGDASAASSSASSSAAAAGCQEPEGFLGSDTGSLVGSPDLDPYSSSSSSRLCVTLLVALRDLLPGEELFVGE